MATHCRAGATLVLAVAAAVTLAGCGGEDGDTEDLSVTNQTPTFIPDEAQEKQADADDDDVEDPGLHLAYTLQGTVSGLSGGSIITVKVHNLNDVAVPPDALDQPKLTLGDGTSADSLDAESAGVEGMDGLDHPLGAGATTNLRYPFDVTPDNLSDSKFRIGNVVFTGQL